MDQYCKLYEQYKKYIGSYYLPSKLYSYSNKFDLKNMQLGMMSITWCKIGLAKDIQNQSLFLQKIAYRYKQYGYKQLSACYYKKYLDLNPKDYETLKTFCELSLQLGKEDECVPYIKYLAIED